MKPPTTLLYVGSNPESVQQARLAINEILKSDCNEDTKRVALTCLQSLCEVKNTTVQNNSFDYSAAK